MKPSALAVCITLIAALVVGASGCTTTSNTASPSPSTSPSSTTHDPLLEKFVNVTQQATYNNASNSVQAWNVTWNNGTSVTILATVISNFSGTSATVSANVTLLSFPTTQDATNFLNAFDKTNYSLTSTNYSSSGSGDYYNVTGHYPGVYKQYSYTEGSALTGIKGYELIQYDNIIQIVKATGTL